MKSDIDNLLSKGPKVINIGLRSFYQSVESQGIEIVHIDYSPPAQGDPEMIELLDKLL